MLSFGLCDLFENLKEIELQNNLRVLVYPSK